MTDHRFSFSAPTDELCAGCRSETAPHQFDCQHAEGCPVSDPDCTADDGQSHDACEAPSAYDPIEQDEVQYDLDNPVVESADGLVEPSRFETAAVVPVAALTDGSDL